MSRIASILTLTLLLGGAALMAALNLLTDPGSAWHV